MPSAERDPTAGRSAVDRGVLVALAAIYVAWSTTYLGIRLVVQVLPPLGSSGVRFVVAGAMAMVIARLRGARMPTSAEWRAAAVVGTLLFAGGNGLVAIALQSVSSGLATLVVATVPLWTGLISAIAGRPLARREWLGVVLGVAGVAVLMSDKTLAASPGSFALLVLSPMAWSLGTVLSTKWPTPGGLMTPALQMLVGGLALSTWSVAACERWPTRVPWVGVAATAYLVVFGSFVGFGAYSYLVTHARPTVATSYAYVNPLLAIALGALAAGERVPPAMAVSAALVLAALWLVLGARRATTGEPGGRARSAPR